MATRMIVLGLDGATFDLIKPWVAEGKLPSFGRLLSEGAHAELRSTLPIASGSTSVATGTNPGKHGIYDGSPKPTELRTRRVWELAAARGKRVGIVRVPLTHGAEPPDGGFVISGIEETNGVDAGASAVEDLHSLRAELFARQRMQNAELLDFVDHHEWDLLWVTFDTLDRVQRFFWRFMDPAHPAHPGPSDFADTILAAYQLLDECLAEIVRRLDDCTGLLVMSGHGGCALEACVALDPWLETAGFLTTKPVSTSPVQRALNGIGSEAYAFLRALRRSGLGWLPSLLPQRPRANEGSAKASPAHAAKQIDWTATRVFCPTASGGLRINLVGREPEGIVAPEDFSRVRHEVRAALLQLADPATGGKVVRAVHLRDELYRGSHVENAPDLVVELADPYAVVEGNDAAVVTPAGRDEGTPSGRCTRTGIFMLAGAAARCGAEVATLDVCDVAPTLLHLLGLPSDADMDGAVAAAVLADGHLGTHTPREARSIDRHDDDPRVGSSAVEGLGYQ